MLSNKQRTTYLTLVMDGDFVLFCFHSDLKCSSAPFAKYKQNQAEIPSKLSGNSVLKKDVKLPPTENQNVNKLISRVRVKKKIILK